MPFSYLRDLLGVSLIALAIGGVSHAQQDFAADASATDSHLELEGELERAIEAGLAEEWFEGAQYDPGYNSDLEAALEQAIEDELGASAARDRYDIESDIESDYGDSSAYQEYWEARYEDYDYDTDYYDYYDWFGYGYDDLEEWGSGDYGYDDSWNLRGYEADEGGYEE